jgi:allantoate deiminase
VRDAGKYDGALGVLVALACVERLHQRGIRLPFALEVLAFADEEGLRYHTAYLGSEAIAGTLPRAHLERTDKQGITLAEAIRAFGGDPAALDLARKDPQHVLGYLEVHIEQGPMLEAQRLPVGIVTAIAGQSRIKLVFAGAAGHAGTVPMSMRRDPLGGAAEFVLAVELAAHTRAGLVATIGQINACPGVSNVIPGQVELSLDVRHHDDHQREHACHDLQRQAQAICGARQLDLTWQVVHENPATPCAPRLSELLGQAAEASGLLPYYLPSGAGHDTVAMAHLTDVAMLFVRCAEGISHHPAESVDEADVAVAIEVMDHFIERAAQTFGGDA